MSCPHGNHEKACDLCDEIDAAYNRGYEAGGKVSVDLTMKHLRRAESAEAQLAAAEADTIERCAKMCQLAEAQGNETLALLKPTELAERAITMGAIAQAQKLYTAIRALGAKS